MCNKLLELNAAVEAKVCWNDYALEYVGAEDRVSLKLPYQD